MERRKGTRLLLTVAFVTLASAVIAPGVTMALSPVVLLLTEETLPVQLVGSNTTGKSELQSPAGVLKGEGLSVVLKLTSVSAGTYEASFTTVKKGEEACNSSGDFFGLVLLAGSFTLVHDIAILLGIGILFNVSEFTIECGATKIKVKGKILGLLLPSGLEQSGGFESTIHCSSVVGVPKETKYYDSGNTERTAQLLANFGTGFKESCEEITANLGLTASKMIELMND